MEFINNHDNIRQLQSKIRTSARFCMIFICIIIGTSVLSACTIPWKLPDTANGTSIAIDSDGANAISQIPADATADTIVADLVAALGQVLPPISTTIQTNVSRTDIPGRRIVDVLADTGYGIQRVEADQGIHLFRYEIESLEDTTSTKRVRYRISIGTVDIERNYKISGDNSVQPTGPMKLGGSRASLVLDDSKFTASGPIDSEVSQVRYMAAATFVDSIPAVSLLSSDIVENVSRAATNNPSYRALNSSRLEVDNLFYSDSSNFGSVFDKHETLIRQTIIFANDSMRLGPDGKQLVQDLAARYVESTDIFGVVGCSNGPTSLEIGNEGLALGRAKRITEELLAMGIPRSDIMDEGCWAPRSQKDRFPSRGVVLELWREKA